MQKNQFLRVQNSLLKLQDFMKLKERERVKRLRSKN